jgi:hypothetical protein
MHGPDHLQTATFYYMRCFLVEKSGRVSLTLYFKIDFTFLGCYCFNLKWLRFLLFVFFIIIISNVEIIGYKNLLYFKRCIIEMVGRKITIINIFIIKFKKLYYYF